MRQAQTTGQERSGTDRSARPVPVDGQMRARLAGVAARRRWVFRSTVMLSLAAVALCFLVAWRRDETTISSTLGKMNGVAADLQAQVEKINRLPADPPTVGREILTYYASDADRFYASQATGPVIVAATAPARLILKPDGLGVIIHHNRRLEVRWLSTTEYDRLWARQEDQIHAFEQQRRSQPIVLP